MNRHLFALALGAVCCVSSVAQAAVYDPVYWVGGDGEWTGDVAAVPEYSTGNWSTDPNATTGLPAKFVLGRNDGIRVGQVVGPGNFDHDRVPCADVACTTPIPGGVQLGTDIYISNGATVTYNPNRQILASDPRVPPDNLDRFGDWRIQPDSNFPGTPTLNLSNGSTFVHQTTTGGDEDGMWTRWNGAALNIDDATFSRTGDSANGFSGGAWMFASFHGYANSVQTVSLTNGGRFENQGQAWFGQTDVALAGGNEPGIRIVMTINDGHMDLTGGDEYGLDNDGLLLRSDLAFVYNHKPDGDTNSDDDETYIINFTGPGTITVDGLNAAPIDIPAVGAGRGGIRVARQTGETIMVGEDLHAVYEGGDEQASYQDLWNLGILRANNLSGLDAANFNDYFTVTNNPGDNDYKLTSTVTPTVPPGLAGDFNGNGTVDAADYVLYRDTLGSTTDLRADANGSLNVDPADLLTWRRNFGNTAGPGNGGDSLAAVPEPSAMLLLIVGLSSLVTFRRR